MTLVIGLTGSIASGKSTVARMFREMDIPVIDADQISRDVVEPGEAAYEEIVHHFGESILQEDGSIDRKKLGQVIFSDEDQRSRLNSIVHPKVRQEMISRREYYKQKQYAAVVLDIPLLYESNLTDYVEKTLVVYVNEKIQLERLMERDQSGPEDAKERIQSQMPVKKKADLADAVIDNNGSIEESYLQLKDILHDWNIV
jgi:dephospho-CoA kinase